MQSQLSHKATLTTITCNLHRCRLLQCSTPFLQIRTHRRWRMHLSRSINRFNLRNLKALTLPNWWKLIWKITASLMTSSKSWKVMVTRRNRIEAFSQSKEWKEVSRKCTELDLKLTIGTCMLIRLKAYSSLMKINISFLTRRATWSNWIISKNVAF